MDRIKEFNNRVVTITTINTSNLGEEFEMPLKSLIL